MAQGKRYSFLKIDPSHDIQDKIIDSLESLRATKKVDERGRQTWGFEVSEPIKEFTDSILQTVCTHLTQQSCQANKVKDSPINDILGERGLEVCPSKMLPKVVRTGDGPDDFVFTDSGHIAIVAPMTHEKVAVRLAANGVRFSTDATIDIAKLDRLVILPDTQFRVAGAFYLMSRPVRRI
jgi:hypothetical protein